MNAMRAWMRFLLLATLLSSAHAEEFCELPSCGGIPARIFSAKIIAVIDGDTVLIRRANGLLKIRLADIDAPEVGHAGMGGQASNSQMGQAGMGSRSPNSQKAQDFGETSKQSLSDMVLGKQVQVVSHATDQYGRMVAHLGINGLDVNAEQIRRGMAWEYSNFHSNRALIALQEEAKSVPRGLWVKNNPTPPWVWRKQHPNTWPAPPKMTVPPEITHPSATPLDATCGNKNRCPEMMSCEEARHYFTACGAKKLDGNRNGVPCEKLCGAEKK